MLWVKYQTSPAANRSKMMASATVPSCRKRMPRRLGRWLRLSFCSSFCHVCSDGRSWSLDSFSLKKSNRSDIGLLDFLCWLGWPGNMVESGELLQISYPFNRSRFLSFSLARINWLLLVLMLMPKVSAISWCLNPSRTYRLKTVRYPLGS